MKYKKKTSDALRILDRQIGDDPELRQKIEEERIKADIAQTIYDARCAAGLSHEALARLVGTKRSVIEYLEDANYENFPLNVLCRVSNVLGCRFSIEFGRDKSSE